MQIIDDLVALFDGYPELAFLAALPFFVAAVAFARHGAETFSVDAVVSEADPDSYDALVLPGGVANPDQLRTDEDAVAFVRGFVESGRPVAAICHAPWTLVEADVVRGRRMTSWSSLQTDLRNAGAEWVDEEVVVDGNLVTSRKPDDLPAFNDAMVELFAH